MQARFLEVIFSISVCLTYPLLIFPVRESIEDMLKAARWYNDACACYSAGEKKEREFYGIGSGCILLSFLTALAIPKVEVVFGFVGSTAGTFLCFFTPPVLFLLVTQSRLAPSGAVAGDQFHNRDSELFPEAELGLFEQLRTMRLTAKSASGLHFARTIAWIVAVVGTSVGLVALVVSLF